MKIGTLAASTTTTINLTWLPQYIFFVAATVPTLVKTEVYGDGIITDIDGAGCDALNAIRMYSQVSNGYLLPLANGIVKGKNTAITITNAVAGTVDVYGIAQNIGSVYVQMIRQYVLANSGAEFKNFAYLAAPSSGATDVWNISYRSGVTHQLNRLELNAMLGLKQNPIGSNYSIDNLQREVKLVQLTPAAAQTVYLVRYVPVGGVTDSAIFSK